MKTQLLVAVGMMAILVGCAAKRDGMANNAFKRPLLSPGAQFGALPPAVQNTVTAEAGSEVIWDIVKDTSSGQTVYKVYFENKDIFPPLFIARDGSVLNQDLTVAVQAPSTAVKLVDLPAKVLEVIHDQVSRSEVASIDKALWGNRTVYVVTFKGQAHTPKLYVEADGTMLKDAEK